MEIARFQFQHLPAWHTAICVCLHYFVTSFSASIWYDRFEIYDTIEDTPESFSECGRAANDADFYRFQFSPFAFRYQFRASCMISILVLCILPFQLIGPLSHQLAVNHRHHGSRRERSRLTWRHFPLHLDPFPPLRALTSTLYIMITYAASR
jgi:hypothetical protein